MSVISNLSWESSWPERLQCSTRRWRQFGACSSQPVSLQWKHSSKCNIHVYRFMTLQDCIHNYLSKMFMVIWWQVVFHKLIIRNIYLTSFFSLLSLSTNPMQQAALEMLLFQDSPPSENYHYSGKYSFLDSQKHLQSTNYKIRLIRFHFPFRHGYLDFEWTKTVP